MSKNISNDEEGTVTVNSALIKEAIDNLLPEKILKNIKGYQLEICDGKIVFNLTKYLVASVEVIINIREFEFLKEEKFILGTYAVNKGKLLFDLAKWRVELEKVDFFQLAENQFRINLDKSDKLNLISKYVTLSNLIVGDNCVIANIKFTKS